MSENSEYHGDGSSLSIEETNKLRIQLGLKPLESNDTTNEDETEIKRTDNFVHTPAINIGDIKMKEKLENKLKMRREERERKEILLSEKSLGDDINLSNEEFLKNVLKKKIENEAKNKNKIDKDKESSDEDFSDKLAYKRDELSGISIEHKASRFDEAGITILTLKDKNILDEENDDVLVNVNLLEREREEKNLRNKKIGAYGAFVDSGDEDDPLALLKPPNILAKYDEVIDGEKRNRFVLDSKGKYSMDQERAEEAYRKSFFTGTKQNILDTEPRIASDYLSPIEVKEKFKPKKRKAGGVRTVRPAKNNSGESESKKSKKEDGELAEEEGAKKTNRSNGRVAMDSSSDEEDNRPPIILTELQSTLVNMDLKRQLSMIKKSKPKVEGVIKMDIDDVKAESDSKKLVFSNTEEFTKSIYSTLVAKRKMDADVAAQVKEEPVTKPAPPAPKKIEIKEEPVQSSGWQPEEKILSQPQIPSKKKSNYREQPIVPKKKEKLKLTDGILGDEVQINQGIYSTLLLVKNKGYLEDKKSQPLISNPKNKMLRAQYFQEEKIRYDDIDQKCPRRERRNLPEMPFIDKTTFDPEIKLEYHDDQGRPQPPKEAFRALSHRFHGKTSGKIKSAKRLKKMAEQAKINTMGDTDQKLMKMQSKMKSENRFCVPLSGKNSIIPAAIKKSEKK